MLIQKKILIFCLVQLLISTTSQQKQLYFENSDCLLESESKNAAHIPTTTYNCAQINEDLKNCTCADDFIDCSNLGFQTLPNNLTNLPSGIGRLLFSNNQIQHLNDALRLSNESSIRALDLRRNKIEKIGAAFFAKLNESLEYLSLCGNVDLNDIFNINTTQFARLNSLQLNHAEKSLTVRDAFFTGERFPQLSSLELNDADLKWEKMPFSGLGELLILRLDSNNLNDLPCESFKTLYSLSTLNLNFNKVKRFDKECLSFVSESLKILAIRGNNFGEANLADLKLDKLVNLEVLLMDGNNLLRVPYELLKNLKMLSLLRLTFRQKTFTPVPVSLLDEDQVLLPKLASLDLSNSNLSNLPKNSFSMISNELTDLNLKNSSLRFIERDAFADLKNLNFLDLSDNFLKTLNQPSSVQVFDYDVLKGNINLKNNFFECSQDIEWFINFYNFSNFDKNLTCSMINGSVYSLYDYVISNQPVIIIPTSTDPLNVLAIILIILIVLVLVLVVAYIVRRKRVKQRQQQYRYRYFTERSQDDGFDTDNVPVYRDCTVSLRINDSEDATILNNNFDPNNVNERDTIG